MEKEFNEIIKKIDSKSINEEHQGYDEYEELSEFINKKLSDENDLKIRKFLLEKINIILSHAKIQSNLDLFRDFKFINQENFILNFINNIHYYIYPDHIQVLFTIVKENMDSTSYQKLFSKKNLLILLSYRNIFKDSFYEFIFEEIKIFKNKEFYLKRLININFPIQNLNDDYLIKKYIDEFLKAYDNSFILREKFQKSEILLNKINKYINSEKEKSLDGIINMLDKEKISVLYCSDTLKEIIKLIILDILKNEQSNLSDIKFNNNGHFTTVLIIKNKVIKIGHERATPIFIDNPYILRPILRLNKKSTNFKEFEDVFIEVEERVDTTSPISQEDKYVLYKKARNLGIIFSDLSDNNVGILLKDNVVHWTEELNVTSERLGLIDNPSKIILKKGDIVLMDKDFIYEENASKIHFPSKDSKMFEQRFLEELRKLYQKIGNLFKLGFNWNSTEVTNLIVEKGFDINYVKNKITDDPYQKSEMFSDDRLRKMLYF